MADNTVKSKRRFGPLPKCLGVFSLIAIGTWLSSNVILSLLKWHELASYSFEAQGLIQQEQSQLHGKERPRNPFLWSVTSSRDCGTAYASAVALMKLSNEYWEKEVLRSRTVNEAAPDGTTTLLARNTAAIRLGSEATSCTSLSFRPNGASELPRLNMPYANQMLALARLLLTHGHQQFQVWQIHKTLESYFSAYRIGLDIAEWDTVGFRTGLVIQQETLNAIYSIMSKVSTGDQSIIKSTLSKYEFSRSTIDKAIHRERIIAFRSSLESVWREEIGIGKHWLTWNALKKRASHLYSPNVLAIAHTYHKVDLDYEQMEKICLSRKENAIRKARQYKANHKDSLQIEEMILGAWTQWIEKDFERKEKLQSILSDH